jgi:nucleoside-diphosphate-sugar epimerase
MKILMTGGTGFLGRYTAWQLIEAGYEVYNLERDGANRAALESRPAGEKVKSVSLSPQFENLSDIVKDLKPDVCLCVAAVARVKDNEAGIREMIATNILMPSLIARALMDLGSGGMVCCGTSWQTAGGDGSYVPFDFYSGTKQASEALIQAYVVQGLSAISLRMYDNYGEDDTRNKIVDLLFDSVLHQKALAMSPGEQLMDLVYVEDAARALMLAVQRVVTLPKAVMETYAVMTQQPRKLRDIAQLIGEIVGKAPPIEWGGRSYRDREVMVPYNGLPLVPGWAVQTPLEDGLKKVWASKQRVLA